MSGEPYVVIVNSGAPCRHCTCPTAGPRCHACTSGCCSRARLHQEVMTAIAEHCTSFVVRVVDTLAEATQAVNRLAQELARAYRETIATPSPRRRRAPWWQAVAPGPAPSPGTIAGPGRHHPQPHLATVPHLVHRHLRHPRTVLR